MALQDEQDANDGTNEEPLTADSSRNDPETDRIKPSAPFSSSIGGHDEQPISLMSDLWLVVSVITFIADVGSDLLVSVQYYNQRNYWYFGLTLGLMSTASLILQIFSTKWFHDDGKRPSFKLFIVHLFQMGPLYRYWSAVKLCWLSRHGEVARAEERFVSEWRDLCMLRLLGAFVHSAPQCVLQLFILTHRNSFVIREDLMIAIAGITSLISVVWALVCYSKALRDLRDNARDLPWLGFTCQVLWRGCMITSRVVALVLFASHFKQWMLLAVAGHWMLMALWLSCQRTQFCVDENGREHPCKEKIFNSIIAFIYIFCFFNTKEGMTRKRIVLYYSVMLVEDSLLISMWYPNRTLNPGMTYAALAIVWGGFVLGVIFMVLYYRFYHHSHTFKGMFLRKRRFTLHGRKLYGLYFCCCFRIKRWELGLYDVSSDPQLLMSRGVDEENGGAGDIELEAFPRDNSQHGNLYWDHDDIRIRPLNGACVKGRPNSPEGQMLLQNAQGSREDTEEVPDIVITAASPLTLSPRDSQSSLADNPENGANSEMTCACNDHGEPRSLPHYSPVEESPVEKAKRMLASKLHKDDETKDEVFSDADEDIPKINYGSVSFGNRYSLVSSDCISLSSESSLSSFTNSLNDLLDRMGVSAKANHEPEHKAPKTSTADEGIFSDERDSPTKSSSDKEMEPAPVNQQKDIKNRVKSSECAPNSETAITPGSSQEEEEVIESIMDAPSSPHASKKISPLPVKDEGNESESTDVSSDGISNERDRRHSYDEMLMDSLEKEEEEINKRHSFDMAELSRKSKRAKKKSKNRKRHNKTINFDNFVSTPLKPGKFGSLRKSFERLSKIQEDHEELGMLSDEALPAITEPLLDERLPSNDGGPISNGPEKLEDVHTKPQYNGRERPSSYYMDRGTTGDSSPPLWVKKDATRERHLRNNTKQNKNFGINDDKKDSLSLEEIPKESKVETTFFDEELSPSPQEEPSEDSSDEVVLVEELSPSRFSTVRLSRENVPLACLDEVDDLDDLGTDSDSLLGSDKQPRSVSPGTETPVVFTQPDIYATDSNDTQSIKARSLNDFASSGSSLFENLLYLEAEERPHDEPGRPNKRHTYDFGSDRIAKQGKVKRLGTSSSHNAMQTPGSPVWVHKAIFKHRRRKPKPLAQTMVNKSDSAIGFIQEIRV